MGQICLSFFSLQAFPAKFNVCEQGWNLSIWNMLQVHPFGVGSCLTCWNYTKFKRLAKDKHYLIQPICQLQRYTITILHQLLIYTSKKHSLLSTWTFGACASLFRHPVWLLNKSIYASLLIKMLSFANPSLACLVLFLSVVMYIISN